MTFLEFPQEIKERLVEAIKGLNTVTQAALKLDMYTTKSSYNFCFKLRNIHCTKITKGAESLNKKNKKSLRRAIKLVMCKISPLEGNRERCTLAKR